MNFFRALGEVSLKESLLQAIVILAIVISPLLFFSHMNVISLPLVTAFVLGYIVRAIPQNIDSAPEMPSFSLASLVMDFARGIVTFSMGAIYFVSSFVLTNALNNYLFSKGYFTDGDKAFVGVVMCFLFSMSFLLLSVGMIRFGLTNDARAYLYMRHNIRLITSHFGASISFLLNAIVSLSVLGVGFLWCLAPGLLFFPKWVFVLSYLMGCYGSDLGLVPAKEKRKNDALSIEPEKQKQA